MTRPNAHSNDAFEEPDNAFERRKILIGIRMTLIYSLVYGGFVALSVFRPTWMGKQAILGLNLAVAYGLGLIVIAILAALIYNHLCRVPASGAGDQPPSAVGSHPGQQS